MPGWITVAAPPIEELSRSNPFCSLTVATCPMSCLNLARSA